MSDTLSDAETLKFRLLAEGLTITPRARATLRELTGGGSWTPADYASTTGLILRLDDDVWVNAPFADYNDNFVCASPYVLDAVDGGLSVAGEGLSSVASYWIPPVYHGTTNPAGTPYNNYVFTHGDRVRMSPIQGCALTCKFCNIPYEDRYAIKPVDAMVDAVHTALIDRRQPAHHVLISGGTPRAQDIPYLQEVYRVMLTQFPEHQIDIMMVPVDGLLDVAELSRLGVHQLSINLEVFDEAIAHRLMPNKARYGIGRYLDFIEHASEFLGPGRVRSMLMVGLEPAEHTLAGVQAILQRGGVPVLSPFRPDPSTPLSSTPPMEAEQLESIFLRARDLAEDAGGALGPDCAPCTHNTLTLASPDLLVRYVHPLPLMA